MKSCASSFPVWLSWHRAECEGSLVILSRVKKKKEPVFAQNTHFCFPTIFPLWAPRPPDFCHLQVVKLQTVLKSSAPSVPQLVGTGHGYAVRAGRRSSASHVGWGCRWGRCLITKPILVTCCLFRGTLLGLCALEEVWMAGSETFWAIKENENKCTLHTALAVFAVLVSWNSEPLLCILLCV